jgi:hypothetical protein
MDLPMRSVLKDHHTKGTVLFELPVMGAHPEFRRDILYLVTELAVSNIVLTAKLSIF